MSSINRVQEPPYYHREYKNDLREGTEEKEWLEQTKRVTLVSLPFFSLYSPLSKPISLAMGGLRIISTSTQLVESLQEGKTQEIAFYLLQTTIAAASLAGTLFAHPVGMLVTTGQDLIMEVNDLIQQLESGHYQQAIESCANIINNALYLGLFLHGGLELSIASFTMQILLGIYHSRKEFIKGNYLEGCGHLGMAIVRSNQLRLQIGNLQLKNLIEHLTKDAHKSISEPHVSLLPGKISSESPIKTAVQSVKASIPVLASVGISYGIAPATENGKVADISDILIEYGNNPLKIPPINYAAHNGRKDVVEMLLNYGANINQPSKLGTPLEIALENKHLKLAAFLIDRQATATVRAATMCCENHLLNELQILIKANPEEIIKSGTLVTSCCESAFLDGLEFVFKNGATIPKNFANDASEQILYQLLSRRDPKYVPIVKFMIKQGAACNYSHPESHRINKNKVGEWHASCSVGLIVPALYFEDEELVRLLIENKALLNTNIKNTTANSHSFFMDNEQRKQILCLDPLYKAVFDGKFDIANMLITAGSQRNSWLDVEFNHAATVSSLTMEAQMNDYFIKIRKLKEFGFINHYYFRNMMLNAIRQKNDVRWVELLFELGAESRDEYLEWAIEKQNKDIVNLLLTRGAKP